MFLEVQENQDGENKTNAEETGADADGNTQTSLEERLQTQFSAELDQPTARLIRGLDGSRSLDEALTAAGLESAAERETGLSLARRMLEVGFLELCDSAPTPPS